MIRRVISGAQIGADIAGLRAARAHKMVHGCDLETGGWVPKGGRIKGGTLPDFVMEEFGLEQTESDGYPARTRLNVQNSDGTIRFAHSWYTAGEKLTQRLLIENKKPRFDVELRRFDGEWATVIGPLLEKEFAKACADWIRQENIEILNIAGNGDREIEDVVERFMGYVFEFDHESA